MKRDSLVFLQDILDSIIAIDKYVEGVSLTDFLGNQQLQDSVVRRFEIIGEAAKNIGDSIREKGPTIPWKKIAGLRDVLIHAYFGIDLIRIFEAIQKDLPPLKDKISEIILEEKK